MTAAINSSPMIAQIGDVSTVKRIAAVWVAWSFDAVIETW